jgi:hypothetical protein
MEGKWQDRCRGRKTEQIRKKNPGQGEKFPGEIRHLPCRYTQRERENDTLQTAELYTLCTYLQSLLNTECCILPRGDVVLSLSRSFYGLVLRSGLPSNVFAYETDMSPDQRREAIELWLTLVREAANVTERDRT